MEPTKRLERMRLADIGTEPQVRGEMDPQHLTRLAGSIAGCGLQQPITVRMTESGRAVVVVGHQRLEALRLNGVTEVDVLVENEVVSAPGRPRTEHVTDCESVVHLSASDPEARTIESQLAENVVRRGLDPVEQGTALNRLAAITGLSGKALAAKFGYTEATVSRLRALTQWPQSLLEAVKAKRVPASTAALLAKVDNDSHRESLAAAVAAGELTREQVVKAINHPPGLRAHRQANANRERKSSSPHVKRSARLSLCPGATLHLNAKHTGWDTLISAVAELLGDLGRARESEQSFESFVAAYATPPLERKAEDEPLESPVAEAEQGECDEPRQRRAGRR